MTTTWTDGHSFEENEEKSAFHTHDRNPRWVSRCKVCGSVGYLYFNRSRTESTWRHKPLSKVYRQNKTGITSGRSAHPTKETDRPPTKGIIA